MKHSTTPIEILDLSAVRERQLSGLMEPLAAGAGLEVVDCSDDRSLTEPYYALRTKQFGHEVAAGRYFGATSGLAVAGLVSFAAEHGEQAVKSFVDEFTPEAFVDICADLSDRAHQTYGIDLNQHSADSNEANPIELANHKHCDNPLGCAFAIYLGSVLHGSSQEWQIDEAKQVLTQTGTVLPLDAAVEGITIMQRQIPEDFGLHRGALHHAQTKKGLYAPVAIHEGHHAPNEQAALVIDLANYRSNANRHNQAGLYRYHHTPGLAVELLPRLLPELRLDPQIVAATGLLLATSTRMALSGPQTPDSLRIEVIPAEYAQAA